jgi:hypothetical protein
MKDSIDTTVKKGRKPAVYAHIGFICVHRSSCGGMRVQLLTSGCVTDIDNEG